MIEVTPRSNHASQRKGFAHHEGREEHEDETRFLSTNPLCPSWLIFPFIYSPYPRHPRLRIPLSRNWKLETRNSISNPASPFTTPSPAASLWIPMNFAAVLAMMKPGPRSTSANLQSRFLALLEAFA